MSSEEFKQMALSFPGTASQPHFNRTAFKVTGRRIFATLHGESESVNIVLVPEEQKTFCTMDKAIYPVPNKWGVNGWTTFELSKVESSVILDALNSAYEDVLKSKKKKG